METRSKAFPDAPPELPVLTVTPLDPPSKVLESGTATSWPRYLLVPNWMAVKYMTVFPFVGKLAALVEDLYGPHLKYVL